MSVAAANVAAVSHYKLSLSDLLNRDAYYCVAPDGLLTGPDLAEIPPPDDVLVSAHDRGWLIEPDLGGYLHTRLYEIRACPIDDFLSTDRYETWASVALDAGELLARARCLLAGPAEYSFGGNLLRGRRAQDRITGHPLVIATRQTPCCGRLTEIAVSSLFGSVEELYALRPERQRGCGESHPRRSVGARFVEVLPKLRKIISRNNEVLSWGPGPLLALHAETALTGAYVDFDLERWPTRANGWIDMQAWEATWRTATHDSTQATALDVGGPATADAKAIVSLLQEMGASWTCGRLRDLRTYPAPPCSPLGPPDSGNILLPIRLDAPRVPLTERSSGRTGRKQPPPAVDKRTDVPVSGATSRAEQSILRSVILEGKSVASCALCGMDLPKEYLVAAHIWPRRRLPESERWNIPWIVMLACKLCDTAFEKGDLFVDSTGTVRARAIPPSGPMSSLGEILRRASGRPCTAFTPRREAYFQRHRVLHGHV
jgi:hypothetical protein